jgi:PAS domain S-box-containing protein
MAQEKDHEKGSTRPEDVRDRKRAEETIRGQADLLQKTFDSMTDAIFILEAKDPPAAPKILECNEAASVIFGYDKAEMLGKTTDFLHVSKETLKEFQSQLYSTVQQGRLPFHLHEFHMKHKDSSEFPSEHVVTQLLNEKGERTGWVSIVRDITERKRAEQALQESEEKYRKLFEEAMDGIALGDPNTGILLDCNQALAALVGRNRAELIGQHQTILHPPSNEDNELSPTFKLHTTTREGQVLETQVITATGEIREVEIKASLLHLQGRKILQGIFSDITERRKAENALKDGIERERLLADVVRNASLAIGIGYPDGRLGSCNPAFSELTGYTEEELKTIDWNLNLTPPEWQELTSAQLEELRRTKKAVRYEKEHIRKNGSRVPIEIVVHPKFDSEGNLQYYFTFITDITERKQMEEELRKLASVVRYSSELVNLATPEGKMIFLNKAGSKMLGIDPEEVQEVNIMQVIPDHLQEKVRTELLPALTMGGTWEGDLQYRNLKTNQLTDVHAITFTVKDPTTGTPLYLANVSLDITERKRAEEASRRRAEELAALQATVLDITSPHDLPLLLQTIVERAARLLGAPAGGMYLCDPEKQEARCAVSYNTPHDYTGTALRYGEGAAGIVAKTGTPLIVDDYRTWQGRATAFEEKRPFRAVLTVPMIWQGRVTGVIHVLDYAASRRFTQTDQELLTLFANHAAIAVENTRLLEQEKHHAEELTRYSTNLEQLVIERTGKLAESERRFRELSDLLPQIVFEVDENGNVQYMNRAGFAATGLNEEEFSKVGLNASHFLSSAEHDRATRGIQRVMTGEMIGEREFTVLRRDGTSFPALVYTAPITREGKSVGLRGIAIDITQRKRAEEELRAARERLEYVVASNPAVIYSGKPVADYSDWHLTYVSESVVTMLGFEPKDFVGHPEFWDRHVPSEDARYVRSEVPLLWKKGQHTLEYRFLHKDGTYRWIRQEARVVRDADGRPIEISGYWTDVTERKRLEEELGKSQRLAAIGELAGMVGHDLRNPLQGIMGVTYDLRTKERSRLGKEGKGMLDLIEEAVRRCDKIITDLQEYSTEIRLELHQSDAKSITNDVLESLKIPRNIHVVNSARNQPKIMLDTDRMRRVLLNLIRNAVDAMPNGGTLTIASKQAKQNLQIVIKDTGEGMAPETVAKLWNPLFTTKARGMGFGLPVAKRFVKAHGGSISIETKLGKGSTFTVMLPIKTDPKEVKKK